jgi:hypothetical protein
MRSLVAIRAFLHPAVLAGWGYGAGVRFRRATIGHRRHPGDARQVVRACLDRCWTGTHLVASPGHYRQFWTRDVSFSTPALIRLSETDRDRVLQTFDWAISTWRKRRSHVTTTIHQLRAWPSDLFDYGVDSLPLLLAAMRAAGADAIAAEHRPWIEAEVRNFVGRVVDPASGLVRNDRRFSAHRDTFLNSSNAYGNVMVALLAKTVAETGWADDLLGHHFKGDWSRLLMDYFWTGASFRDRLDDDETSGEANVWPFYSGIVTDPGIMRRAFDTLATEGYASPHPIRYEVRARPNRMIPLQRILAGDYQTTSTWTSLGSMYLSLLGEIDPVAAARGTAALSSVIERDGTFWEVLDASGEHWRSRNRLAISEEAMLWGAIFLDHLEHPELPAPRLS